MLEPSKLKLYNPRHPERTLLYQTAAEHYETWLELASAGQFDGQGDHHSPVWSKNPKHLPVQSRATLV